MQDFLKDNNLMSSQMNDRDEDENKKQKHDLELLNSRNK